MHKNMAIVTPALTVSNSVALAKVKPYRELEYCRSSGAIVIVNMIGKKVMTKRTIRLSRKKYPMESVKGL